MTAEQALILQQARKVLDELDEEMFQLNTYDSGMVRSRVEMAEEAIFQVLNGHCSYLRDEVAERAIHGRVA